LYAAPHELLVSSVRAQSTEQQKSVTNAKSEQNLNIICMHGCALILEWPMRGAHEDGLELQQVRGKRRERVARNRAPHEPVEVPPDNAPLARLRPRRERRGGGWRSARGGAGFGRRGGVLALAPVVLQQPRKAVAAARAIARHHQPPDDLWRDKVMLVETLSSVQGLSCRMHIERRLLAADFTHRRTARQLCCFEAFLV
jgi:hypothetical protein